MERGYYKAWRCQIDSEIWDKPPLYFKVWHYLLMSADYKNGTLDRTHNQIADKVQWVEKGHSKIPNRKAIKDILDWLEAAKMIKKTTSGNGNRKYTLITIVNYDTYQINEHSTVTEQKQKRDTFKEVPRSTKKTEDDDVRARGIDEEELVYLAEMREVFLDIAPTEDPPTDLFVQMRQIAGSRTKPVQILQRFKDSASHFSDLKNWRAYFRTAAGTPDKPSNARASPINGKPSFDEEAFLQRLHQDREKAAEKRRQKKQPNGEKQNAHL